MNLQEIRQKYPQYNDLSDQELLDSFYNKYYSDIPKSEFYEKMNYKQEEPSKLVDAGLGIASGVLKGLSYVGGLPGDLERLTTYLPFESAKKTGGFDYGQPGNDESFGKSTTGRYIFPSSQQVQDYLVKGEEKLSKKLGIDPALEEAFEFNPETTTGKYLQTGTEFASPGIASKSKIARDVATKVGFGGGLLFQGAEDLSGSSGVATGVTTPAMLLASMFARPNTASRLASDALQDVSDAEIKTARLLEQTAKDMDINLMPGEVFDNKNIRNLTRDVVSSEKGSPIIYSAAKDRRDQVLKAAEKQADLISSAPESQRKVFDLIKDTSQKAIKDAKIERTVTAQKAGYKVSNNQKIKESQVFNVINKIDEQLKTLPNNSPNKIKLNQLKNQLIAKRVKVKGQKKLKIIPETNINKLDSTFKQFRDDYRATQKGIGSPDRYIDTQLGGKLFTNTEDGILDILNKELRTNKSYAKANDQFSKLSNDLVDVVEKNVLALSKNNVSPTTVKSFIFDSGKNNVSDINKTFAILNKTNPEASIQIANIYFRNALNQSFKMTKQGDDLTQGFKLIDTIAGTGQQRKNFMAVIDNVAKAKNVNPKELKVGFEKMINVLERTGRVANLNNPGFDGAGKASRSMFKDYAAFYTFNPRVRLATKWGEFKAGKAWEELANVFVQDQSVDALIDLAKTNPESKRAALTVLNIIDFSQGLQSEPLTQEDIRQLELESQ